MSIIKFLFWTMPFGGIFALLNPHVMETLAHGSDKFEPGCLGVLCKVVITAVFWCAVFMLYKMAHDASL